MGWIERPGGHQQARTVHYTLLNGCLEPGVQPAAVADRGVAGLQRVFDYPGDSDGPGAARLGHAPPAEQVVGEGCEVVVAVYKTRHNRQARCVNLLSSLRNNDCRPRPGGCDAPVVSNEDGRVCQRLTAAAVYQCSANYRLHNHPTFARWLDESLSSDLDVDRERQSLILQGRNKPFAL